MSEHYLVTGAAGHLGFAVIQELLSRGKKVRALVLPGDKAAKELPPEVELVEGDLLSEGTLDRFFNGIDPKEARLIHCAGIVNTDSRYSKLMYEVNVGGTKRIVDECAKRQLKKLVYVSSVHTIPLAPKGQFMAEPEISDPALVVGPYAKTKAEATAYVKKAAQAGLDVSIVYPSGICGIWDYGRGYITEVLVDYYKGRLPFGMSGGYDFVDVRDVASGIASCAEKGISGEGYILANRYVSIPEFLGLLYSLSGKKPVRRFFTVAFVRMLLPLYALWYKLNGRIPLFNKYSVYTLSENSLFSHKKAERELGYKPRPFEETVRDTLEWLIKTKRINPA
ncbi:SDR family oxidoreductase [Spirochaetota bacterium]